MQHAITHDLDPATVRRTLEAALAYYRARYPNARPALRWFGDDQAELRCQLRGLSLLVNVQLAPGALRLNAELPLLLRPFQDRAQRRIETEVRGWIDRARAGEFPA